MAASAQLDVAGGGRASRGAMVAGARDAAGADCDSDPFHHDEWTHGAIGSELGSSQPQLGVPKGEAAGGRKQVVPGVVAEAGLGAGGTKKYQMILKPSIHLSSNTLDL
jgi:hypothetical protein